MKDPQAVRELITSSIALHDLMESVGVHLPQTIKPQQLSCPFHGADVSMSARYYPETNSMYCFACKKSWDPISFWMQYSETKFMEAARQLSVKFRVDMSKLVDIKNISLLKFGKNKSNPVDKRKMALYILEQNLRLVLPIEDPQISAKMLYVLASARHVEDPDSFAKLTFPMAKRIRLALA